ncbi:MAG: right-handed parallel beta-helix repeat-containing protein [Myxococcota bacterium]|nr:right-handed parallel beta-helix repeat-containing protein [Myxococcota bacterium]
MTFFALFNAAFAAEVSITSSDDINAAVNALSPGDTLIFSPGNYSLEGTEWTLIGQSDSPITLRAEAGAQFVIFPGDEGYPTAGIQLVDSSWVVLDGLELGGDSDWETGTFNGIIVTGGEDITVQNMVISDIPSSSILITGEARRVTIQDTRIRDTLVGSAIEVGCPDAACFTESIVVNHNWIHGINGESEPAIHLHHGTQGATIMDNVVYDVEQHGLYLGSAENGDMNIAEGNAIWNINGSGVVGRGNAMLRNNIIFNIVKHGIHFQDPGRDAYDQMIISFNSIVNTGGWGAYLNNWSGLSGNVLANNAICSPIAQSVHLVGLEEGENDTAFEPISPYVGHFISNNVLCGQLLNLDIDFGHYIVGDGFADFIDVEAWNLYPSETSQLRDAADVDGQSYIPEYDFNGVVRTGSNPEVGAYEWDGFENPGWAVQEGFKSFDLNYSTTNEVLGGGCCRTDDKTAEAALVLPLLFVAAYRRREERI